MNILISACLLGKAVRYNGTDLLLNHPLISQWRAQGRLIPVCPEVTGGLPVPRPASEIIGYEPDGRPLVMNIHQEDVSDQFIRGAHIALELAQQHQCKAALMTEGSPSCGSAIIHDGEFSGKTIPGMGITSALLTQHGISVFNQYQLEALEDYIKNASLSR